MQVLTRRSFAHLLGAGAVAAAAAPSLLARPVPAETIVRLNANENPFGPSPAAMRAATEALRLAPRYPDEAVEQLTATIAQLHGVANEQVLLGCGSSEVLKVASLAYTSPTRKLIMADPTFE